MARSKAAKWLAGDTTYQQQLAGFKKSAKDYKSQYNRQRRITNRDFQESGRTLNRQGKQDRRDQKEDFAGRGIVKSGVYAKALGDYNTDFNSKVKNLKLGKSDKLGDLSSKRTNFMRQLRLEKNSARQDALRRRAAKLGL